MTPHQPGNGQHFVPAHGVTNHDWITLRCAAVMLTLFVFVGTGHADSESEQDGSLATIASPLHTSAVHANPAQEAVVELALDRDAYQDMRAHDTIKLTDFILPGRANAAARRTVDLNLERMQVLSDDAQVVVSDPNDPTARTERAHPEVALFRGRIAAQNDSRVFLSFAASGAVHGYVIENDGRMAVLTSGPHGVDVAPVMYSADGVKDELIQFMPLDCQIKSNGDAAPIMNGAIARAAGSNGSDPPCREVEVAIETDYAFTNTLFNGDMDAASEYVLTLLGAVSEIYAANLNVDLEVVFINLWDEPGGPSDLFSFQDYWNTYMTNVDRDVAHLLAASGSGGVAFLWGVCNDVNGYAASSGLNGFFPYPLEDYNQQNWDPFVVSHELGHNFGTLHTHNYCPPLDQCSSIGGGGPTVCLDGVACQDGTIMSYCHLCPGGYTNIALDFHPVVRLAILDFLDSLTCDLNVDTNCELADPPPAIVHVPDDAPTISDAYVAVADGGEIIVAPGTYTEPVELNGWSFTVNGQSIFISKSVELRSANGPDETVLDGSSFSGSVLSIVDTNGAEFTVEGFTITGATASDGAGAFVYGCDTTFVDCAFIGNTASGNDGGAVSITAGSANFINCAFENNNAAGPGGALYYKSGNGLSLSNCSFAGNTALFGGALAIVTSNNPAEIDQVVFEQNAAESAGGAIFNVASNPLITNSSFIQNSASDGGAVLNMGASSDEMTAADSLFCDNEPNAISGDYIDQGGNVFDDVCNPADLTGDNIVDVSDLLLLLGEWGPCENPDACPADLDGDGSVGVSDLLTLLGNWG